MSLDARILPKTPPMLGCHSEFDHHRLTPPPPCVYDHRNEERGCEGCSRRGDDVELAEEVAA